MTEPLAPSDFRAALASLRGHQLRPEIALTEIPGPTRLAPYAAALSAEVLTDDDELAGHGRFVILYDPDGQPAWHGDFRIIVLVKAPMDSEVADDPLLGEVGWSWLTSALDDQGAGYHHLSGTVTRVLSETFGGLELSDQDIEMEIRGSWTPVTSDLGPHLQAWLNLVEISCDLVPIPRIIPPSGL
ncbi:enoyl-CoA hydratase [Bowdeniella nasicola]|uniref:Enoyl-CoA hydratase n=1 Tax=Bowdeniella nasicola TaxID=208480 RepID=A0A1Q5Q5C2_9ACTO|nr:DUF3000 domain-containing protein [Bowdeniella nasicola]OKL54902.1 enoyl-CoA hydratase [Bowdeniella nasicola]